MSAGYNEVIMNDIAVKFDSVSFSYKDVYSKNCVQVLENASFHIHCGEFVAMVGPNGSGKTTVVKLLFGLETPDAGSIEIFGDSTAIGTNKKRKGNLSYVPQGMPADSRFPITVRDIVRMGLLTPFKGYPKEGDAVAQALEKTGIADLAQRSYSSLSGGQKRRSLVARALAANPDLLVLDEPAANMDSESEVQFYSTLALYKGKTTILIVTHDTEFVSSLTDKVLCLGDGSRTVVQHRIEQDNAGHGNGTKGRVIHGENISTYACCE